MKINVFMLIILLMSASCIKSEIIKNPFKKRILKSCHDLTLELKNKIKIYQYQGWVELNNQKPMAVMHHQNKISLIKNERFDAIIPWQILKITKNEIHLTASLPPYCNAEITHVVLLHKNKGALNE